MRYAVVGAGSWGANHVRTAASLHEEGLLDELVVCDVDERRARRLAEAYDLPFRTDVADCSIDAATVATPTRTHHDLGTRLLESGVDLLVEAPLAATPADARDLVETAADHDRTLAAGHSLRYLPALVELRRRIEGGELGTIEYLQTNYFSFRAPQTTAGVLDSIGIHDVDIFAYLLEPTDLEPDPDTVLVDETDRATTLVVDYGETVGVVNVSWETPAAGTCRHLLVAGDERSAYVDYLDDVGLELHDDRDGGSEPRSIDTRGEGPLKAALIDFLHAVETGSEPRVSGRIGAEAVSVLERARESTGRDAPLAGEVDERS